MKLNRLETDDRLYHFIRDQSQTIWQGADDCLKRNPDSLRMQDHSPYIYLFAHTRTADDGVTKKLLWQPRLTKPKAQTNSYLFRAQSHTDIVEICWLIPPRELWKSYERGNFAEDNTIMWSIDQFKYNRKKLEAPGLDDLSDEQVKNIMTHIWTNSLEQKKIKQVIAEASSTVSN